MPDDIGYIPRGNQEYNWSFQLQYNPRTGNWLSDSKDIILRFFQSFFYQFEAGQGLFHFEPSSEDNSTDALATEILIVDQATFNLEGVEKRPVIAISRGPMAYGNTSMDQLLAVDFKTGKKSHTDLLSGTFVANCISRNGLEAERLALLVAKALRYHRKELQKAGFFYIGHQVQVGQESAAGSLVVGDSKEDFVNVPVIFPVHYQDFWQTTPEAETLEKIRVRLHTIATSYRGTLLYPDAIDSDGNVNEASAGVTVTVWETS